MDREQGRQDESLKPMPPAIHTEWSKHEVTTLAAGDTDTGQAAAVQQLQKATLPFTAALTRTRCSRLGAIGAPRNWKAPPTSQLLLGHVDWVVP